MSDLWTGFTIDASTTVDRDDAIWAWPDGNGGTKLSVYVTDLSHIKKGSGPDERARERLETLYRGSGTTFMLPKGVQDKGSLDEGKVRRVLRIQFKLDPNGDVIEPALLACGKFKSEKQFSYSEIPGVIADESHPYHMQIKHLSEVCRRLLERRRLKGALAFYDLNHGWVSTEEGYVKQLKNIDDTIGYVIIQELMILANATLAEFAAENEIPVLFRNHTAKGHAPPHEEILQQLDNAYSDPTRLEAVRKRIHLFMHKATYGSQLDGHFGLNVPAYVHATSPLRRYPDMVVQRQIVAHVRGEELPYTRDEITKLGEHATEIFHARREAQSDFFRTKANEKAERRKGNARTLKYIEPKDFERVLKVLCDNGEPPGALAEAYPERLRKGLLTPANLMVALFRSPKMEAWDEIRQVTYDYICERVWIGSAVLNAAKQTGLVNVLKEKVNTEGEEHSRFFVGLASGQLTDGPKLLVGGIKAYGKKEAQQRAHCALIGAVLDFQVPRWVDPVREPVVKKPRPMSTPSNYVAALNEYCQQRSLGTPAYAYESEGPSHQPKFLCTASVGKTSCGIDPLRPAARKKDAKELAAKALLDYLRANEGCA